MKIFEGQYIVVDICHYCFGYIGTLVQKENGEFYFWNDGNKNQSWSIKRDQVEKI